MQLLDTTKPALGMGCWAIGGPFHADGQPLGFDGADDNESIRTIHAAIDAGILIFDTAAVYGAGHSERLLGKALKDRPEAIIVTKFGTTFDETSGEMLENDSDPSHVADAVDASLRRLQRDAVDIVLLHLNSLPLEQALPLFAELEKLRCQGKIRGFGWSTDFPDRAQAMANTEGFMVVEHAMNVFMDVSTLQATVVDHALVALIRSPLAMGILTGKFDAASVLPSTDVRSVNSDRRDYFKDARPASHHLENLNAIRELLMTDGRTLTQGALCWLLAKSSQNIPIPGARTVNQVTENAAAMEYGPLRPGTMKEIEELLVRKPEGPPRAR